MCIRHTGSRAVALSHLDGSNTKEAIGSMIMSIQAMTHAKDDQLGSLCIHIIGGFLDEGGYSRGNYFFFAYFSVCLSINLRTYIGSSGCVSSTIRENNPSINVCPVKEY